MIVLLACVSCARRDDPAPQPAQDVVRFLHDPIRIDGKGAIARVDFHRIAVLDVAERWLPVLALEGALERELKSLRRQPPSAARVRALAALVRTSRGLRERFPDFPQGPEKQSETCTLRLAVALAYLEVLLEESSEDALVHAQRIEDALKIYAPVLTKEGASCCGVAIDAREVWPELLARSDVAWRAQRVRTALDD